MKKWLLYVGLGLILFGLPFIAYTSQEYVGAKKCKLCHIKIFKSWKRTGHATAFDVLKPGNNIDEKKKAGLDTQKDYTSDPKCIECHITGNSTKFKGIQCEACHGAGKGFTRTSIMNKKLWKADPDKQRKMAIEAGLVIKPDEKTCTKCHSKKSPTFKPFNFEQRYKEIEHHK